MSNYSSSISQLVNLSLYKTFGWTSIGLFLTSFISYFLSNSIYFFNFFNPTTHSPTLLFIGCFVAQFLIILSMGFAYRKLNYPSLLLMFLSFASLNGIILSTIFFTYDLSSITGVFFIASGMFLFMSFYGLMTKHDLTPIGVGASMILFGMLIVGFINIFLRSYAISMFSSFIGVLIFSIFTAYDIQNIKKFLSELAYNQSERDKLSILGALQMYQNFINLFLNLLRLLGHRKRN